MNEKIYTLWDEVSELPSDPGVYFFCDADGTIVYIGKATSLRSRVQSYHRDDIVETRGPLIADMLERATHVQVIPTDSVLEAVIQEARLIKKWQPKYNTKEKDNKSFYYIVITEEAFPRVFPLRARELAEGELSFSIKETFGPFPHGNILREALKIIRKIFPFRDRRATQSVNERFYKQLNLTPDTTDTVAQKEYAQTIEDIRLLLRGEKSTLLDELQQRMDEAVTREDFEEAARIRDQIFALTHIQDVSLIQHEQTATEGQTFRIEAYDVAHLQGDDMVGVMTVVIDDEAETSAYRKFHIHSVATANDTAALQEILRRRFAHPEWDMPRLIVVDGGAAQRNAAQSVCNQLGIRIPIVGVVKDRRHKPKQIIGSETHAREHEKGILLANQEAHRFAISFHRQTGRRQFGK